MVLADERSVEGCEGEEGYHGEVAPVAEVEGFAPEGSGQLLAECDGGLTPEERLVGSGKEVVEVVKAAVELVGVLVPDGEPAQLERGAKENKE